MSIFDQLKSKATIAAGAAINNLGNKKETFTFSVLPESVEQMKTLPEAAMDTPFKTAALTVCALCAFAADQAVGIDLLNFLRGSRPLSLSGRSPQLYHFLLFWRCKTGERLHAFPALYRDGHLGRAFL